jgi:lipopolysaccharide/colanic/teichoic acid biosynthesis glycosyltransferase
MAMSSTKSKAAVRHDRRRKIVNRRNEPSSATTCSRYLQCRIVLDFALAVAVVLPVSLTIGLLVALVRLTSRGPGIYRQIRVGKGGKQFTMYKIRTMCIDAETGSGPVWTQPNDLRVNRLGRLLRRLHLDELPQIYNVLRGEMSFVGPRPERPEFVRILSEVIPHYHGRLAVRPGITGLAQINLPPDTDLMSVRRKLALDLKYIEQSSLWLDARLLLCTVLRVFKIHEGLLTRVLCLQRDAVCAEDPIPAPSFAPAEATPETILLQAVQVSATQVAANQVSAAGKTAAIEADGVSSRPR